MLAESVGKRNELKIYDEMLSQLGKLENKVKYLTEVIKRIVVFIDPLTAIHQQKVADLSVEIAKELKMSEEAIENLYLAASIHDIGKLYIPSELFKSKRQLTPTEYKIIKTHPQIAYDLLQPIGFNNSIPVIIFQHHERFNGSGYPLGVSNENMLAESRVLALADVVEAMASSRPYREAYSVETVKKEILRNKGILYDSEVVDACMVVLQENRVKL